VYAAHSLCLFSGYKTHNETFGKESLLAREPCHAALFYPCQIMPLCFIILYFVLDFLIFSSSLHLSNEVFDIFATYEGNKGNLESTFKQTRKIAL
jgi:hypothetical protein